MNNHQNYVPFRINRGKPAMAAAISAMLFAALAHAQTGSGLGLESSFHRVATFPVFLNTCEGQPDSCIGEETVAEIVAASKDGNLLIYTDAASEKLGFVDITKASDPKPAGVVSVDGSPTSVAVAGEYALVGVDTTADLASPSGTLKIVHIPTRTLIRTIDIGGQPDSVAVSPDGRYAAIAIENQRNEDLCVGGSQNGTEADEDECEDGGGRLGWLPQLPAGFLVIVDLAGAPANWTTRKVDLTGIATLYPSDPEPEFVDINAANVAAVTLQENNHVVLVHLPTGQITGHFSARSVDLTQIDTDDNGLIEPSDKLTSVLREPDAVVWTSLVELATANEGDLAGGSRGFTIFGKLGDIRFDSGNAFEHLAMRVGHYPEGRSDNKGNETEGLAYGEYGNQRLLFAGSERSSIIAVYRLPLSSGPPQLVQVLPANVGPEGLLAIPQRNLFVAASENDDRAGTFRSTLTIYELRRGDASYPTILSANGPDGLPIPWGALSGIAADPVNPNKAYTIYDSFFRQSRIYTVDAGQKPALITDATVLRDAFGNTFDFDLEGIATREAGQGFWLVSEGAGSCAAAANCPAVTKRNLLIDLSPSGVVRRTISLPKEVDDLQLNNGYEGVTSVGAGDSEVVYVAFQREWLQDPKNQVRIGRYEVGSGEWNFFYYPIDTQESPNGGWVGLSEIVALDENTLAVLERDNQAGTDARIKKIYSFSIRGLTPIEQGGDFPVVAKRLVRDLMSDLTADHGLAIEKVEGLAVLGNGDAVIVTDNDGVDDSSGETQWINLGKISPF